MPTYEYACTNCNRRFEVVQKFSDAPLEVCEVCEGRLKRVFHPVGIVLKGSGFYSTDNRGGKALSPGSKEPAGSSSEPGSSGSGSGSGSSGSESGAAKSESKAATAPKSDTGKSQSGKTDTGKSA